MPRCGWHYYLFLAVLGFLLQCLVQRRLHSLDPGDLAVVALLLRLMHPLPSLRPALGLTDPHFVLAGSAFEGRRVRRRHHCRAVYVQLVRYMLTGLLDVLVMTIWSRLQLGLRSVRVE